MAQGNWEPPFSCSSTYPGTTSAKPRSHEQIHCLEEDFTGSIEVIPDLRAGINSGHSPGGGLGYMRLSFLPQKLVRLKKSSKANQAT